MDRHALAARASRGIENALDFGAAVERAEVLMADADPEPADVDDNEDDVDELQRDHGIEDDDPEADDLDEL